jgi:hypothetical protein
VAVLANFCFKVLAGLGLLLSASTGTALVALEDSQLSDVTGEGIALGFTDMRLTAGPTTFFEATGDPPPPGTGFQQADGRYYGISMSGNTGQSSWVGFCGAGSNDMGCPIGDTIDFFAPFDNPFVLRAFNYSRITFTGATQSQSILELLAPTNSDPWRMATWSEVVVGGNTANRMQGQILLTDSKLSVAQPNLSVARSNNKFRIVKHTDPADPTVGFIWENSYEGDFRFSINQVFASPDVYGVPPIFSATEGFYALNIQAYVPLGQMFYQDLILDDTPANDGNFRIELTRVPNSVNAYTDFYSLAVADAQNAGYTRVGRPERYYETHGFFKVGAPGTTNNSGSLGATGTKTTDITDGIFFHKGDTSATFTAAANRPAINPGGNPGAPVGYSYGGLTRVNIGDVNIEGLLIQHMEITTCSASGVSAC